MHGDGEPQGNAHGRRPNLAPQVGNRQIVVRFTDGPCQIDRGTGFDRGQKRAPQGGPILPVLGAKVGDDMQMADRGGILGKQLRRCIDAGNEIERLMFAFQPLKRVFQLDDKVVVDVPLLEQRTVRLRQEH